MTRSIIPLVLLIAAQQAAAQDRVEIRGADSETAARVAEIAAEAKSRGLPADPVLNEARLGALHGVQSAKILTAARGVASRLEIARTALQPAPSEAEITHGAEALKYGISEAVLRDIKKVSKGPVTVPIAVLIQLVAEPTKMQVKRASRIVLELIQRGADTKMIAALGNDVNSDVALGISLNESLAFRINALQPLLGPAAAGAETAADALTQGLGPASAPGRKKP